VAASCQQLSVAALLYDVAVVHDQDEIGVSDGGEAVRDDEARPVGHEVVHGLLDLGTKAFFHDHFWQDIFFWQQKPAFYLRFSNISIIAQLFLF